MADAPQIDTFVTLFQFVALAIPAVAILLQVVLQVQTQYVDESGGSDITSAWEFRLIELSLIALVAGGGAHFSRFRFFYPFRLLLLKPGSEYL